MVYFGKSLAQTRVPFGTDSSKPVPPEVVDSARTVPVRSGKKYFKLAHQNERGRIRPAALRSGTERAPAPVVTNTLRMHRRQAGKGNGDFYRTNFSED